MNPLLSSLIGGQWVPSQNRIWGLTILTVHMRALKRGGWQDDGCDPRCLQIMPMSWFDWGFKDVIGFDAKLAWPEPRMVQRPEQTCGFVLFLAEIADNALLSRSVSGKGRTDVIPGTALACANRLIC